MKDSKETSAIFDLIDSEPWLGLLAYADKLEERGNEMDDKTAKTVRWIVKYRRYPAQKVKVHGTGGVIPPTFSYFWLWKKWEEYTFPSWRRTYFDVTSAHAVPWLSWDSPPRDPVSKRSTAYKRLIRYLSQADLLG